MSRYRKEEGCLAILLALLFLIASIAEAFNGNFIPILIVFLIIVVLWIASIYNRLKNERKQLAETAEGKVEIETNDSKIIIAIIIIILGVIISMVFQSNKRQYLENKKNERIEYIPSNFNGNIDSITNENNTLKKEIVWLNENLANCNFKLPENFILQNEISNDNLKIYGDKKLNLSLNISNGIIPDDAEFKTIDELSKNISTFADSWNENNKLNFDDFKLIDYKIEKLGNLKAIKIEQSSTKISGKNIEMFITTYNVIDGSSYYNITYIYPRDSLKYNIDFDKIKKSFEFNFIQKNEALQNIEINNYIVKENINEKVYFYNSPDEVNKRKGYLTSGDLVYVEEIINDFGYVDFTNSRGLQSKGWIKMIFLEKK